jgi:CPA1 family monovalent cation:H+ antiporter
VVIIITLVGQGLALPWIVKWIKPTEMGGRKSDSQQVMEIELQLISVAIKELNDNHPELIRSNVLLKHKHNFLNTKLEMLQHSSENEVERQNTSELIARFRTVMMIVTERERKELHTFRTMEDYDDDMIRLIENRLDLEEENMVDGDYD